jgi:hypothetical protein
MMVLARETDSGIKPGVWGDRLAESLGRQGRTNGPIFRNKKGQQAKIGLYDDEFLDRLVGIRVALPHLFAPEINVAEVYSLQRSLHRGSTTEARNRGVHQDVIELNNRWQKVEAARGRKTGMSMMSHYTEIRLSIPTLWKYSKAL